MGELARQPGCPELAKTPLELLTPRPGDGFSTISKLAYPSVGAIAGALVFAARNWMLLRPVWAGIQLHFIGGGIGAYACTVIRDWRFAYLAERDEVCKHYISLHPEDFPPFERKRFRDVYKPFNPVR